MDCTRVRELLPDYSVELLSDRASQRVASHLAACGDCRRELKAMDAAVALVETYGAIEPPAGLFNAVRNRIESGEVARQRPPWWTWWPARAAAMGMAVGALALGILMPVRPVLNTPEPRFNAPASTWGGDVAQNSELA